MISLKQMYLLFVHFVEYYLLFLDDNGDEESQQFSNSRSLASISNKLSNSNKQQAFASIFANFSLALLIKMLLIKKILYISIPIFFGGTNIQKS